MHQIHRLMRPEEHVLLVTREHGAVLVAPFLRATATVSVASAAALALAGQRWLWPLPVVGAALAGLIAARAIVRLIRRVATWHARRLVLTDRKVMLVHGTLRRRVSALSLAAIDHVEVVRRWRLLGVSCGALVISAGSRRGTLFAMRRLPHPDRLMALLVELSEHEDDLLDELPDDRTTTRGTDRERTLAHH
jgi:hypothetical protein